MSNAIAKRDEKLDALKGFAILLVVIGHIMQYVAIPETYWNNLVYEGIYSFHMPLFMFISGYLAYRADRRTDGNWLGRRFLALALPFITWSVINYWLCGAFTQLGFLSYAWQVMKTPDLSFWFLWVLFLCDLVLFLINQLARLFGKAETNLWLRLALMILACVAASFAIKYCVYFGLDFLKGYLIYFLAGNLLHQIFYGREKKASTGLWVRNLIWLAIFIFTACIRNVLNTMEYLIKFNNGIAETGAGNQVDNLYKIILAIIGIRAMWGLFDLLPRKPLKPLTYLGMHTIEIYILQKYLITNYTYHKPIDVILSFVLSIGLAILLSELFGRNRILGTLFFGKAKKKEKA